MKCTPNLLKLWLAVLLCLGAAQSLRAKPWGSFSANHYVNYSQAIDGTAVVLQYGSSIGLSLGNFGDFDPAAYFPTSISFTGSNLFPGGQLDIAIPYTSTIAATQGPGYYGLAGGAIFSPAPSASGYMFADAGLWSQNFSEVSGPLSATLHGGAFEGSVQSPAPFELDLLPNVPLFTLETLAALISTPGTEAIALSMVQPFSPGFPVNYSLSEIVAGNFVSVLQGSFDPILNPNGFILPGSTLLSGHEYLLSLGQSAIVTSTATYSDTYLTGNAVRFIAGSASVPDQGVTLALLGTSLLGLGLIRRRLIA